MSNLLEPNANSLKAGGDEHLNKRDMTPPDCSRCCRVHAAGTYRLGPTIAMIWSTIAVIMRSMRHGFAISVATFGTGRLVEYRRLLAKPVATC